VSHGVGALRAAEWNAVLAADATITHSSHEAALLQEAVPEAAVHLVPWLVRPQPAPAPFADRAGVVFLGSYGHPPNLDAAWWLLDRVMPEVWAQAPAIKLLLAGSNLPDSLRAHAQASPGSVEVLGQVADLATLWGRARLSIAPLRFGAGLKGKVLDSLAAGVPCVCTPVAAEGMGLPEKLQVLVAARPDALARLVLELHGDAALNARLREAGLEFIADRFNARVVQAGMALAAGIADQETT
jgi:glycosyltransferase involved in cell wall biosynthesis